jgi:hypothetical protein
MAKVSLEMFSFRLSNEFGPGLPDGLFSIQKYQFWYFLEGLWFEIFVIFLGRLVFYYRFGVFYGCLVFLWPCWCIIIFHFGLLYQEKSGNPDSDKGRDEDNGAAKITGCTKGAKN